MTKDGRLFHIDFGHFLGNWKSKFGIKRERVKFILTPDFVHAVCNGEKREKSERWVKFKKECVKAYLIVRSKANLLINLLNMMLSTGILNLGLIFTISSAVSGAVIAPHYVVRKVLRNIPIFRMLIGVCNPMLCPFHAFNIQASRSSSRTTTSPTFATRSASRWPTTLPPLLLIKRSRRPLKKVGACASTGPPTSRHINTAVALIQNLFGICWCSWAWPEGIGGPPVTAEVRSLHAIKCR